jgi:hypothetical protein
MELKPVKLTNQKAAVVRFWAAAQLLFPDTWNPQRTCRVLPRALFPRSTRTEASLKAPEDFTVKQFPQHRRYGHRRGLSTLHFRAQ